MAYEGRYKNSYGIQYSKYLKCTSVLLNQYMLRVIGTKI